MVAVPLTEYGLRAGAGGTGADDAVNVALLASQRTHISRFAKLGGHGGGGGIFKKLSRRVCIDATQRPGASESLARVTVETRC